MWMWYTIVMLLLGDVLESLMLRRRNMISQYEVSIHRAGPVSKFAKTTIHRASLAGSLNYFLSVKYNSGVNLEHSIFI